MRRRSVSDDNSKGTARGILPWILLANFRNVIKGLPIRDADLRLGEINVRNVEYFVSDNGRIIIPAASSLMIPAFIKVSAEEEMDNDNMETRIVVKDLEGFVYGYMFDGSYFRVYANRLLGDGLYLQKVDKYRDYDLNNAVKKVLRLRGGRLFSAFNKSVLWKKYGIRIMNTGVHGTLNRIIIRNRSIIARENFETNFFTVSGDKEEIKYPGVMSALLTLIHNKRVYPSGRTGEILDEFLKDLSDVGREVAPFSEAILRATGNNTFVYNLGELEMSEKDREQFRRGQINRTYLYLSGKQFDRLVRGRVYANVETGKVYLGLSFYPDNPVAQIEFNYPPLSVLPLSAVIYSKKEKFKELINDAKEAASKQHIDLTLNSGDFDVLADAEVSIDDIVKARREGYPSVETLTSILNKSAKLSKLGDLFNLLIGKPTRVDTILFSIDRMSSSVREEEDETNTVKL